MGSFGVSCSSIRPSCPPKLNHHSHSSLSYSSTTLKPLSKELHKSNLILLQVSKTIKEASLRLLDAFVDGKHEWFSKGLEQTGADAQFLSRVYEWRLNLLKGKVVAEKNLTGTDYSMEFPIINDKYVGKMCKYCYTQVVYSKTSSTAGTPKYGGLAKLHLQEREQCNGLIKVAHHKLPRNTFCTGAAFVAKRGGADEDDGWIIAYVHDEDRNISHVYVVDAKNFCNEPVAVIDLPRRVPYGFHGAFVPFDYEETTT